MKRHVATVTLVLVLTTAAGLAQQPVGTAFTYQGQLKQNGVPVNGEANFIFSLWDAPTGGNLVGQYFEAPSDYPIVDGLFTIELDFTPPEQWIYDGAALWIEVSVSYPSGSGTWELLTPRQRLTATPFASFATLSTAAPWAGILDMPAGFADGVDDVGDGSYWSLTGNAGTTPGMEFLGTTDDTAFELHVNAGRGLRIEPHADAPNVIGGHAGNGVEPGACGATIGGGGPDDLGDPAGTGNHVFDNFGTVSGGRNNRVGSDDADPSSAQYATVAGGRRNVAQERWSAVAGGLDNLASGAFAAIGGGDNNVASDDYANVTGGRDNEAAGRFAVIVGGYDNSALADYSVAAGKGSRVVHTGSFVWSDSTRTGFASLYDNEFAIEPTNGMFCWAHNADYGLCVNNDAGGDGFRAITYANDMYRASVYAWNLGASPALYATSNGTYAADLDGNIRVGGSIVSEYADGYYDRAIPVAYGCINTDGSVSSGTPNFTCEWEAATHRYRIEIDNLYYYTWDCSTVVTPVGAAPVLASTTSWDGGLIVYMYNLSGDEIQSAFEFIAYRGGTIAASNSANHGGQPHAESDSSALGDCLVDPPPAREYHRIPDVAPTDAAAREREMLSQLDARAGQVEQK